MNKNRFILFSAISIITILIAVIFYSLLFTHPRQVTQNEKNEALKNNIVRAKDPDLIQIRKSLNSYLAGEISGTSNPLLINGDPKLDQQSFLKTGLKNFSKNYYKSKFIVLKITHDPSNSKLVFLEFIDKQDKVFIAGLIPTSTGSYQFAYFGQNLQVTPDMLRLLNSQYSFLLKDKLHAL